MFTPNNTLHLVELARSRWQGCEHTHGRSTPYRKRGVNGLPRPLLRKERNPQLCGGCFRPERPAGGRVSRPCSLALRPRFSPYRAVLVVEGFVTVLARLW